MAEHPGVQDTIDVLQCLLTTSDSRQRMSLSEVYI